MAGLRKNSLIFRCIGHLYGKAINENDVIAEPFQFFSARLMKPRSRVCRGCLHLCQWQTFTSLTIRPRINAVSWFPSAGPIRTACLQELSSPKTWKIKALSVTRGVKTEFRLWGVCSIIPAISSSAKKLLKGKLGDWKNDFLNFSIGCFIVFFTDRQGQVLA